VKKVGDWWLPETDHHFVGDLSQYQMAAYQSAMKNVKKVGTAIDVGAHVGIYSARMAAHFDTVFAFEPDSANYACLVHNTQGLGVQQGERKLQSVIPIYGAAGAQRGFGFVRVDSLANTGARGFEVGNAGRVPMYAIDEFKYTLLGLVKIDTEGFEHRVLVGAMETLKQHKPVLIIERPKEDSINVLRLLNYKLVDVVNKDSIFVEKSQ